MRPRTDDHAVSVLSTPPAGVRITADCSGRIVEWTLGLAGASDPHFMRTQAEKMREGKLEGASQAAKPMIPDILAGISLPSSGRAE